VTAGRPEAGRDHAGRPEAGRDHAGRPEDGRDHSSDRTVEIRDEVIRLGQFLKLADLIESGSEAKAVIADGLVEVNGETELRRGRQLRAGDTVTVGGVSARVAQA
jgi:ribosome-associated protein